MNKGDWIGIFAILLMVIGGSLFSYYCVIYRINQCTASPTYYAAEWENQGEYNYSYIVLNIYRDIDSMYPLNSYKYNLGKTKINYNQRWVEPLSNKSKNQKKGSI